MTNLDELEAFARAATQGEWEVRENRGLDEFWGDWHDVGPLSFTGGKLRKDTAYVAAANPATVLSLIAEVRRLKGELLFYACDSATCDCVPGKEDRDSVYCGYRARTALGGTDV